MPKRQGYIYDKMWDWDTMREAERTATKRKKNYGIKKYREHRWQQLTEVQAMIHEHRMETGDYEFDERVSGQNKLRKIAKLKFHPSHIEHQCLVLVSNERVDRALIPHTYASRIRTNMERLFKDRDFIEAYMEPFTKFAPDGIGIPLGIRPSQSAGNIALMTFHRFMTQEAKAKFFLMYLDDFTFWGKTKGEVKRKMKRAKKFLNDLGFDIHEPKIRPVSEGLDFLGFVFYEGGDMYWRKSNKIHYKKRRAKVTNPKRLRELDSAAKGMLQWGNRHCKRLFKIMSGIDLNKFGIKPKEKTDGSGTRIIDLNTIPMHMVTDKRVEVCDWVKNFRTCHGDGRWALHVRFYGEDKKLIINSGRIKEKVETLEKVHGTKFSAEFFDPGGNHYDVKNICILEIDKREISEIDADHFKFNDTGDTWSYQEWAQKCLHPVEEPAQGQGNNNTNKQN